MIAPVSHDHHNHGLSWAWLLAWWWLKAACFSWRGLSLMGLNLSQEERTCSRRGDSVAVYTPPPPPQHISCAGTLALVFLLLYRRWDWDYLFWHFHHARSGKQHEGQKGNTKTTTRAGTQLTIMWTHGCTNSVSWETMYCASNQCTNPTLSLQTQIWMPRPGASAIT